MKFAFHARAKRVINNCVLKFADAFTNEPNKWLHKIAKNRVYTRVSFQPIRTAIAIRVSPSLGMLTRLLFKSMKTVFTERVFIQMHEERVKYTFKRKNCHVKRNCHCIISA